MSNKSKYISCSYCGAENANNASSCCKCGRIIQASEKSPFDIRPIMSLGVILAIIAAIGGTIVFVVGHLSDFRYWYINNQNEDWLGWVIIIALICITTFIVAKYTEAKTFGSNYVISCVIMFFLVIIVDWIDVSLTGDPYESFLTYVSFALMFGLVPAGLVKLGRS